MRLVVQRVKEARVKVNEETIGEIGRGLLVFLGVGREDTEADVDVLVEKVLNLRIFSDAQGKFNLSLIETGGASAGGLSIYPMGRLSKRPTSFFFGVGLPFHGRTLI